MEERGRRCVPSSIWWPTARQRLLRLLPAHQPGQALLVKPLAPYRQQSGAACGRGPPAPRCSWSSQQPRHQPSMQAQLPARSGPAPACPPRPWAGRAAEGGQRPSGNGRASLQKHLCSSPLQAASAAPRLCVGSTAWSSPRRVRLQQLVAREGSSALQLGWPARLLRTASRPTALSSSCSYSLRQLQCGICTGLRRQRALSG